MDFSSALDFGPEAFTGEVIMSLIIMLAIAVFFIVVGSFFRKMDPTKPEKNGFFTVVVSLVEMVENYCVELMGPKWKHFSGYALVLFTYIITCFVVGVSGLPNPLVSLVCPLSIGLCSFMLIHLTAMRANKWKYFKRYIDPFFVFLPINLLSMWAPLLSLSLRLFGNALAGYCLMVIVYYFTEALSSLIFSFIPAGVNSIFVSWIVTPALHLYFDLFSGLIQAMVFVTLTMIWVSQEDPDETIDGEVSLKQA